MISENLNCFNQRKISLLFTIRSTDLNHDEADFQQIYLFRNVWRHKTSEHITVYHVSVAKITDTPQHLQFHNPPNYHF